MYKRQQIFTPDDSRPVVLFDGECNLCNRGVNLLLDRDLLHRLHSPSKRTIGRESSSVKICGTGGKSCGAGRRHGSRSAVAQPSAATRSRGLGMGRGEAAANTALAGLTSGEWCRSGAIVTSSA